MKLNRRSLLLAAGLAGVRSVSRAADAAIEIDAAKPGAEISRHIYGHFIEHLGTVIYDGIWVGPESKVANTAGLRQRFVDDMKRIGTPNLRWPGGCFADGYHWRDGIGPRGKRPRAYNYWQNTVPAGVDHTESNHFGIHEFVNLAKMVGAETYVAANVGSGTPAEFHDWVSYCNAPARTLSLADERAANGSVEPFGIKYWGVGNESWGCGGDMTPGEYAQKYRQFVTQFPVYAPRPFLTATGPRGHSKDLDIGWTTGFFEGMKGHRSPLHGFSLHFYTDFRPTKEKVTDFNAEGWFAVLKEAERTEQVIERHWAEMGRFDPEHRCKFVIDEWGVWYPPGEETGPQHILSQPLTLRDALHTAITFDVFNRHADKIAMANVAQTINCLHSLFLATGDQYVRTPAFYIFEMYKPHMDGKLLPLRIQAPHTSGQASISGSASLKGDRVTLTLTNPLLTDSLNVTARLSGVKGVEARGTVLAHADMKARNTFARPDEVKSGPLAVRLSGNQVSMTLPKHSVAAVEIRVG